MMHRLSTHRLGKDGEFVIAGYNFTRPWASFFPGIAGLFGIPLWVFYVNRGQCIASFGIQSKDEAIMEFLPANKAYQMTPSQGFRTFIKIKNKKKNAYYEPFSPVASILNRTIRNRMIISPCDLRIIEQNPALGIEVQVSYFPLVNEPFAALVREVAIRNISKKPIVLEFLDGASAVVPYGINNFFLKEMSCTLEAWALAESRTKGTAIYKLKTDPHDREHVSFIKGANFYKSFSEEDGSSSSVIIVDSSIVYGQVSDLSYPQNFFNDSSFRQPVRQKAENKTPCAFSFIQTNIRPGAEKRFFSLLGHVFDEADIRRHRIDTIDKDFIANKKLQNRELINGIMDRIFTSSALCEFDLYARQTYLDNVLRGGLPYSVDMAGRKKSIYVFLRKHGDLERDYNKFLISATYFSEGEGNYRDVNQNRRCDVFFNPLLAEKNISDFMNLIQLDGYNPLVFRGQKFIVNSQTFLSSDIFRIFNKDDAARVADILSRPFTLGGVLRFIIDNKIPLSVSIEDLVRQLLLLADSSVEAQHTEGYWSDHWTYNTDLLESFRGLYPDRLKEILFERRDFTYFDSAVFVKPRAERYCIRDSEVRQYHSLGFDEDKNLLIRNRSEENNKVHDNNGEGAVVKTTLIDKFLCLVVNKLSTLDPFGAGIEMEANKPNWYDALNGLPGLFGSSVCETFELKRLIELLKKIFSEVNISPDHEVGMLCELHEFFCCILALLKGGRGAFDFWDKSNNIKESYRLKVKNGTSGEPFKNIKVAQILEFFDLVLNKLNAGIAASFNSKDGYYYTYFWHKMVKFDLQTLPSGKEALVAKEFRQFRLPLFLEGFVHAMRTECGQAQAIYQAVRKSPLWDAKLKMYKVNAPLKEESFELGRVRVFTPGWLENESIWLHMEYKFILELLKCGLVDEFYDNFFKVLIPFQAPQVYGRSILENSSFIVSSAHPDASLHGAGFVARLSGSTAEFIHMWLLMNIGQQPFFLDASGELALRFRPALSARLFTRAPGKVSYRDLLGELHEVNLAADSYSFLFLGKTLVTYVNPKKRDTFGKDGVGPKHLKLFNEKGLIVELSGAQLKAPYAEMVRRQEVESIEVSLE